MEKTQEAGQRSVWNGPLSHQQTERRSLCCQRVSSGCVEKSDPPAESEIKTLSKLKHNNIVKYYGAMSTKEGFFMYMEYVSGGTLEARIKDLGKLDANLVKIYTAQMIRGLAFMHSNHVIHRDLKPANVLISVDGQVKLADFGTAFDLSALTHTVQQTFCGTPAFIAPEVVRKDKHTTSTDIWSLGVIIYNMITGDIPFKARDKYALLLQIGNGSIAVNYPPDCPKVFQELIAECLQFSPLKRPTAYDLLQRPIFSNPNTGEPSPVSQSLGEPDIPLLTLPNSEEPGSDNDMVPISISPAPGTGAASSTGLTGWSLGMSDTDKLVSTVKNWGRGLWTSLPTVLIPRQAVGGGIHSNVNSLISSQDETLLLPQEQASLILPETLCESMTDIAVHPTDSLTWK